MMSARAAQLDPLAALVDAVMAGAGRDATTAETLPAACYTAPAFFDLEVERIFRQDWICVGHVSQVAKTGDYFTVDLFGELLVVVRGPDRIRALSGVCLHRWAPIASGSGNVRLFSCPFHKWGYGLDGQLLGAPFMEQAAAFQPKACRLPEIRSEIVESLGLIFVTLSDTVGSIGERLADLSARLANWRMGELVAVNPNPAENKFNWKIQIETFMECYHHIGAHMKTFEVDYPARLSWVEAGKPGWTICHSPARPDLGEAVHTVGLPVFPDLVGEELACCDYILIYPLTLLAVRPDRVHLLNLTPVGPRLTRSIGYTLVRPEAAADPAHITACFAPMKDFYTLTNQEDTEVNEMQQAGAGSRLARIGRLSHLELTVFHLADYIRQRIGAN